LTFTQTEYWPINSVWNYHCGASFGNFGNLNYFTAALNARYGSSNSAQQYILKSQVQAYEAHRAMFEGYSRNKYTSTGVIQWMLNNAFPEMIWHLYDYYFNPSAAYFATKIACEDLHIMYSYNDKSIWVVNSLYVDYTPTPVTADIAAYTLEGVNVYNHTLTISSIPADSTTRIFQLPSIPNLSKTYFLRLTLSTASHPLLSSNTYWLSTTPDVLDWNGSNWFRTPCKSYADYTGLQSLPKVELSVTASSWKTPGAAANYTVINVSNPGKAVAFFVHLAVTDETGKEIWPCYYDVNYFTLLPGESVSSIRAEYNYDDTVKVAVECWNCS